MPAGPRDLVQRPDVAQRRIGQLIGPEGGLSERERDLALLQGSVPVALGPRVLRTETAPLAALAAINTLWGDFAPR